MSKQCLACGYERNSSDLEPDYECPKCGVVYAKAILASSFNADAMSKLTDEERLDLIKQKASLSSKKAVSHSSKKQRTTSNEFSNSKMFGVIGFLFLIVGVFTPVFSISIAGSLSFYDRDEGFLLLFLSILGLYSVLTNKIKLVWYIGLSSLAVLIMALSHFLVFMADMKSNLSASLADNPFKGLVGIAMNSIGLEWGWLLLTLGLALVFSSKYLLHRRDTSNKEINKISLVLSSVVALSICAGLVLAKSGVNSGIRSESSSPVTTEKINNRKESPTSFTPKKSRLSPVTSKLKSLAEEGSIYAESCRADLQIYQNDNSGDCKKLRSALIEMRDVEGGIAGFDKNASSFDKQNYLSSLKKMNAVMSLYNQM